MRIRMSPFTNKCLSISMAILKILSHSRILPNFPRYPERMFRATPRILYPGQLTPSP
jgi:hypothetical protein